MVNASFPLSVSLVCVMFETHTLVILKITPLDIMSFFSHPNAQYSACLSPYAPCLITSFFALQKFYKSFKNLWLLSPLICLVRLLSFFFSSAFIFCFFTSCFLLCLCLPLLLWKHGLFLLYPYIFKEHIKSFFLFSLTLPRVTGTVCLAVDQGQTIETHPRNGDAVWSTNRRSPCHGSPHQPKDPPSAARLHSFHRHCFRCYCWHCGYAEEGRSKICSSQANRSSGTDITCATSCMHQAGQLKNLTAATTSSWAIVASKKRNTRGRSSPFCRGRRNFSLSPSLSHHRQLHRAFLCTKCKDTLAQFPLVRT